ncbi:MFS transporter [Tumebacillus permanentifrigoris]|uniref:Putative MFS family arabinose efflux permease n=1 Tax=Tumebacillus permanentifrigoris TaxID=378543 RepID=A0A316DBP6_9BACL|nr:MFS transporter [Tumebacillus permanentifrigoris]PWK15025.1 putative MFS family arabinose efflux permease [Tumebacillus permanentifrigoris]
MSRQNQLLMWILIIGVFGILTTEMGVIGILPFVADHFHVSVSQAGLLVSLFALVVAGSGPTMPMLFSGINRKKVMLLVLGVFVLGNIVSLFATNFAVALIARVVPAFFHPIYCSLAFTTAAASVSKEEAPKAVSKIIMGVSAGMVLGVPITSFITSHASYEMAMLFFAVVNAVAFLATWLWVPSMPVQDQPSYREQVFVLKKATVWLSIAAAILINAAVFGVYSYLSEYLKTVTNMSWDAISFMLVLYGAANLIGNFAAGKLLTRYAFRSIAVFPFALGAVYILLFFLGHFVVAMSFVVFLWGILAGMGTNYGQYWIASAAPEAPDFANGLFLTSANVGTTIGTAAGGFLISAIGTQYVVFVGYLALILCAAFIFMRNRTESTS